MLECIKSGLWKLLLNTAPQLGKSFEVVSEERKKCLYNNQLYTMREIARIFKLSKWNFANHLYRLGYVTCSCIRLPYNDNFPFRNQSVTGNERWILHSNMDINVRFSSSGIDIWWEWKRVLFWRSERLFDNITASISNNWRQQSKTKKKCQDLFKENSAMFSQYNAWSHTSFGNQVKIETTRLGSFYLFFYSFLFLCFILLCMLFLLFFQILIRYNYLLQLSHILTFLIQCLEKWSDGKNKNRTNAIFVTIDFCES